MPDTEPRKLRSSFLSRLKQGSNGRPRSEAQTAWPRTCRVLPGRRRRLIGPDPENCTAPTAPMSSRMRPDPRVPSKQVKAKTLPATNLRASSAVIIPASAGVMIAPAVMVPNTKRASISKLRPASEPRLTPVFTRCLPYQQWQHWSRNVGKVGTGLGNFYHDSTAHLATEDFGPGGDDLVERNFMSNFSKFRPVEIAGQALPSGFARRDGTHHGIDAEKAHPAQNKGCHRGRQIHAGGKPTGRDGPAIFGHGEEIGERRRADAVD